MLVVIAGLVITARSIAADLQVIRTYNSGGVVITLLGPSPGWTVGGGHVRRGIRFRAAQAFDRRGGAREPGRALAVQGPRAAQLEPSAPKAFSLLS